MPYKIVLLGDKGVGKSTLMYRITQNKFSPYKDPTIGVAFTSYNFLEQDGNITLLHFWDTAGNERFNSFLPLYIKGAQMVLICFSKDDVSQVSKHVNNVKMTQDDTYIVLVATKIDILTSRSLWEDLKDVSESRINEIFSDVQRYAKEENLPIFFTSSKTGQNISKLVNYIVDIAGESKIPENPTLNLKTETPQKRCCF